VYLRVAKAKPRVNIKPRKKIKVKKPLSPVLRPQKREKT
jgi:hypothetical protein